MDFISNILQELLSLLFNFTGDLGIAIVIVTLSVKIILMPFSIKQKLSMKKQQDIAIKIDLIKDKYKDSPKELEEHLQKHSLESMKSMLGCSTIILQMPIIYALYNTFSNMKYTSSSIILPWISNLSVSDNLFIIPCIYAITMLAPNFINLIPYFKANAQVKFNKQIAVSTVLMSFLFTAKTPVAIGLYFITSSIYSLIEDICFRIYIKQNTNPIQS